MITATIDGNKYSIPTRWEDVTLQMDIDVLKRNPTELWQQIEIYCGIPREIVERLKVGDYAKLVNCLQFLRWPSKALPANPVDITAIPYGAYVDALAALEKAEDPFYALPDILACCTVDKPYSTDKAKVKKLEILSSSAMEIKQTGVELANALINYANKFKNRLKIIPQTVEEKRAGIDTLAKWGGVLVVDNLANGDATKYSHFFQMEVKAIHGIILLKNEQAYFNYRHGKEMERKAKEQQR